MWIGIEVFEFLKNITSTSHLVREFRLLREFIGVSRGFIRFAIKFIDDSELHVFEHVDSTKNQLFRMCLRK
jgi:hypothetical protein